jgi:signal transduction histidine kinase
VSSVERQIATRGALVLVACLGGVGVGTGGALIASARAALDGALLAAAHGHAHPDEPTRYEVEHSVNPVDTWIVVRDDPRVPVEMVDAALASERPTFGTHRGDRVLLLPAEAEIEHRSRHVLIAAAAPAVDPVRVVQPFALAYAGFAAAVAALGSLVLARTVRAAFVPLDRARAEATAALARGAGQRLTEAGPVEVVETLRAFNRLLDRLEAAWAAQARFTSDAAHELRTPVATLQGELDVALRRPRNEEEYREVLASARQEAGRLGRIVGALSAFTRLDAGEAEASRSLVRGSELAHRVARAEGPAVEAAGGRVEVRVLADFVASVNEPLVELAVGNLLRNAARHAKGAPVELRVVRNGFEVHDGGPGIPPEERDAVFVRFGRGARARGADPEGLGLGLAFAAEVARRHGGACTVGDSPLGGVCASWTFGSEP